ncbi:unnamed protein product [Prunus armeniaca]|uniref:E3 ubiquitin protein ligase n=1 Tax=Prunus armeniaca TaxID=36596 RepID=A0A6J5TTZ1_PRUAR|nr:unnamed protein product [Prunus armeniaca]
MENSDSDEPEKKRPHLNSLSPTVARSSTTSPPNNHSVDAAVLQYQNQRLLQQIDKPKHDLQDLEAKIKELKDKQGELDDSMTELEESRRKLVNLKMQKDVASGMHNLTSGAVNGTLSPEKSTEATISLRELKKFNRGNKEMPDPPGRRKSERKNYAVQVFQKWAA